MNKHVRIQIRGLGGGGARGQAVRSIGLQGVGLTSLDQGTAADLKEEKRRRKRLSFTNGGEGRGAREGELCKERKGCE